MPEQSTAALLEKALSMLGDPATADLAKQHVEEALLKAWEINKEIARLNKEAREVAEHCEIVVADSENLRQEIARLKSDNQKLINQIPA